jgi:hypothetical protein
MADLTGLEAELRANGIDVERLERGDPVELTYTTAFPGERVEHGEVGRVCNVFLDLARGGEWTPADVEATVVRYEGDRQGRWRVETSWFERLLEGELTEVAFSERVLDTLEEA